MLPEYVTMRTSAQFPRPNQGMKMAEPKTLTILDVEFTCTMPYDAGHVCNEAEARVLNQTRRENLSNNFRSKVKEHQEKGEPTLAELQEQFAELDKNYEFTVASVSAARRLDPVEREARSLARQYIKDQLAAENRKITDVPEGHTEESWKEAVEAAIDQVAEDEQIIKIAKDTIKQRNKASGLQLGSIGLTSAQPSA